MTQINVPKVTVNIESANVDLSVDIPTAVAPVAPFCNLATFGFGGPYPKTLTISQLGEQATVTAGVGGGSGGVLAAIASKSTTGNISVETEVVSNSGGDAGLIGPVFTQLLDAGSITLGVVITLQGGGMGQLLDIATFTTIGPSFSVVYPHKISIKLDQAAGTASFEFKDGVNPDQSGSANVSGSYDNTQPLYGDFIASGIGANDVVVANVNNGTSAFTLANSDGKYCDYVNFVTCPYDDVTFHNQSGTVEVETGFLTVTGSLATADVILNTPISGGSGEAKSEIFFISDLNTTSNEKLTVGFTANNGASQTIYCQLTIDPLAQTVFDLVASTNVETGVNMVAGTYKIWIELDLALGTATYTDTLGNTGPLGVLGYSPNDSVFYKYSARADTLGGSSLVMGWNAGEKVFSNELGTGKCQL